MQVQLDKYALGLMRQEVIMVLGPGTSEKEDQTIHTSSQTSQKGRGWLGWRAALESKEGKQFASESPDSSTLAFFWSQGYSEQTYAFSSRKGYIFSDSEQQIPPYRRLSPEVGCKGKVGKTQSVSIRYLVNWVEGELTGKSPDPP